MKVKIEYLVEGDDPQNMYWARTVFDGKRIAMCGDSFWDAEKRLLEYIKRKKENITIPEPKEVEV